MRINTRQSNMRLWLITTFLVLSLFANSVAAQTPEGQTDPPVITQEPIQTAVPTDTAVPTAAPSVTVEQTAVATDTPTATDTPANPEPTSALEVSTPAATTAPTEQPTATEEAIVPDQVHVDSGTAVSMNAGESQDIVMTYTLGSNRDQTQLLATLLAPGVDLTGWTLTPIERADQLNDPADPTRDLKARVDVAEVTTNGATFKATWRVSSPAHVETAVTVFVDIHSTIHRTNGVANGPDILDFVVISASPSVHGATVDCQGVDSISWNCSYDTTHPKNDVSIWATATVPAGWEVRADGSLLTTMATQMNAQSSQTGSFVLTATYPIGCPDQGATNSVSVSLTFTYPSGEVNTITTELPLVFTRPEPSLSVTSFTIDDLNLLNGLSTTGAIGISYSNVPCAWQANLDLTDLVSETTTIPKSAIHIQWVEGLPNETVSLSDGTIRINGAESTSSSASGGATIHFVIDLQEQIPPGAYSLGLTIQIGWSDQN